MTKVFTGNIPFYNSTTATAIASIITGGRPRRPTHPDFAERLWTLARWCWKEKPEDRPKMDQVIDYLSDFLFDSMAKVSPIDNSRSSSQASVTTLTPLVQPPGYASPKISPTTTTSYTAKIHDVLLLSPSPPLPKAPTNCFGRDVIIEDLLSFVERSASITLFGAGGTGKTTIALNLLQHVRIAERFGKHRHFMRCDDLQNSLDSFLERLFEAIGARHLRDIGQLRTHLSLSPPCILVLDGVESLLDPLASGVAEITIAIMEISRHQNVCLLATTRMDVETPDFRRVEVLALSADGARDMFHSCCPLGRSARIDQLLEELDFHPLSIDLLASAVRENGWDEATLLKTWGGGKMDVLRATGRQDLEDNIKSILDAPTIQELGTTALETLEAIAAFPNGVKESKLEMMFPTIAGIGEATDELCKFSLIYREDGFIKMLSPFRIYFLEAMVLSPGGITHDFAPKTIQYLRHGVVNPGLSFSFHRRCGYGLTVLEGPSIGINTGLPGVTDWPSARIGQCASSYSLVAS